MQDLCQVVILKLQSPASFYNLWQNWFWEPNELVDRRRKDQTSQVLTKVLSLEWSCQSTAFGMCIWKELQPGEILCPEELLSLQHPKALQRWPQFDRNFMKLFCKKIKSTKTLRPPAHWIHQDSVRTLWVKYRSLHATGFLTFFHTCTKSLMFYCCIPVSAATPCSSGR